MSETEYALVPKVPTEAMWAAGGDAAVRHANGHHDLVVDAVWSAMLAACPPVEGPPNAVFDPLRRKPMAAVASLDGSVKQPLVCLTPEEAQAILAASPAPAASRTTDADADRVGLAILEAHSQWEIENRHGPKVGRNGPVVELTPEEARLTMPWCEGHIRLLGHAALLAALPDAPVPAKDGEAAS